MSLNDIYCSGVSGSNKTYSQSGHMFHIVLTHKAIEHKALPILFTDDTSILLTSPNNTQMQSDFNIIFELIKWFKSNLLFLNFDKTYFIQFTNKRTCTSDIQITYEDKQISIVNETKFLVLFINNNLSWNRHIESIKSKLSPSCYAVGSVKRFLTINTLKMMYYYYHSVMTYGLLFSGNSPENIKIFRL